MANQVDFCGHATLATAFVLFAQQNELKRLKFFARAIGEVVVKKIGSGEIEMCFPNCKPQPLANIPEPLRAGLSIPVKEVLFSLQAYFVIYDNVQDVHEVTASSEQLKKLAPYDVVVSAVDGSDSDYDFISRYFWPANGGEEDPVTGSIHAGLAPFWAERLCKNELLAYQASARGGVLRCRVAAEQVYISGHAVQYLHGYIEL